MTWLETCEELELLKVKFNPYHEIQAKAKATKIDLTHTQTLELKALRARAIELHYIRIELNLNETKNVKRRDSGRSL